MKLLTFLLIALFPLVVWGEEINVLPITQEILESFEKIDNPHSDKIWWTVMCIIDKDNFNEKEQAYPALFFNSIWLTDQEYNDLLKNGEVITKYDGEPIKIYVIPKEFKKGRDK